MDTKTNFKNWNLKFYPHVIVLLTLILLFGYGVGVVFPIIDEDDSGSEQVRSNSGKFTNPLLECDIARDSIQSRKVYFGGELTDLVDRIDKKNNQETSLYFRDMNNGPIIEINTDEKFMPASLLKVPIMMTFFKHAEVDPSILEKKITFKKDDATGFEQTIKPEKELEIGKTYTVMELINQMIKYSDNQALVLLWPNISTDEYSDLYKLLGIDQKALTDPSFPISVKDYSRFFRILFNSSFLSQKNSEIALGTLNETTFKNGIARNIPKSVQVANKFGERSVNDKTMQIHDCGIIYYPGHPYLLCIMTKGTKTADLIDSITLMSDFVYEKIDEQYGVEK